MNAQVSGLSLVKKGTTQPFSNHSTILYIVLLHWNVKKCLIGIKCMKTVQLL